MTKKPTLLLVNENKNYQAQYEDFFGSNGYTVLIAQKTASVLDLIKNNTVEIVLIGFNKPPTVSSPLAKLLDEIIAFDQRIEVLLIAPHFGKEFAAKAIQRGAADCITDPANLNTILASMNKLSEFSDVRKQTGQLEQQIRDRYTFQGMRSNYRQRNFVVIVG